VKGQQSLRAKLLSYIYTEAQFSGIHSKFYQLSVRTIPMESYLLQTFRNNDHKVPNCIGILQVRLRVTLLGVHEIRELEGAADKEDGRVVAHYIPSPFLGLQLEGQSTRVPRRIRLYSLPCRGGKSREHHCLLPDFTEETRLAKV